MRRRFNVAPGDQVLAVTTDREGAPRGEVLRWGLVPHWADDPAKLGLKLINARSETMAEKPAFRDAFARAALPRRRRRLLRVGEAPGRHDAAVVGHARPTASRSRSPGCGRRGAGAPTSSRCAPARSSRRGERRARAHPRPHAGDAPAGRRGGVAGPRDAAGRPPGRSAPRSRRRARARSARPSTTRATTGPTASSPRPRRSRSSERRPCSRASRRTDDRHRRGAIHVRARRRAGRRCCCCTATRRPT